MVFDLKGISIPFKVLPMEDALNVIHKGGHLSGLGQSGQRDRQTHYDNYQEAHDGAKYNGENRALLLYRLFSRYSQTRLFGLFRGLSRVTFRGGLLHIFRGFGFFFRKLLFRRIPILYRCFCIRSRLSQISVFRRSFIRERGTDSVLRQRF